jgi:isocitrate dehydrogenase
LALAVALEEIGRKTGNDKAIALAEALDTANSKYLESGKAPSRKGE